MNGTLVYQLTDPRTADEFAQCWDKPTGWLAVGLCRVPELPESPTSFPVL